MSGPQLSLAISVFLACAVEAVGAEGAGASWPGGDAALPVLVVLIAAASWLMVRSLRADRSRLALESRRA